MSNQERTAVQQLECLIDAYLSRLLALPDQELKVGEANAAEEEAFFQNLVDKVRAEAGRRRLDAAREAIAARSSLDHVAEPIDIEAAKKYLSDAANDSDITLAARDLREIPDEEVMRLYLQLRQLQAERTKKDRE